MVLSALPWVARVRSFRLPRGDADALRFSEGGLFLAGESWPSGI